jgi:hypothetical protein
MPLQKPPAARAPRLPVFTFLPPGMPRDIAEIIASSIPGAAILVFFMLAVGAPTVITNSNWFAAPYIPVTCLLPIVIGMIAPLALEWVRAVHGVSLRRGVVCSFLSGLVGSVIGVAAIFALSAVTGSYNPFGPSVTGMAPQAGVSILIIVLSSSLSAVGGAVLMLFIKKAPGGGQ